MISPSHQSSKQSWVPWIMLLVALWAQVFYCASYGWIHAVYYDYGWYVPPLAVWFFYRKWYGWSMVSRPPLPSWVIVAGILLLATVLSLTRILLRVDQGWPGPLWVQTGVASVTTCLIVWKMAGKSAVWGIIPVILFAMTAVRLPTAVELVLVNALTHGVMEASSWIFRLLGHSVMVVGNQLELMGKTVEVTEGCSGIRSLQSFLMVSLCFGEWLGLSLKARLTMVGAAIATAWVLNVARACTLAQIRFTQGDAAFEKAHDPVGMAAFVVGMGILLWLSWMMDGAGKGRRLVRQQVKSKI